MDIGSTFSGSEFWTMAGAVVTLVGTTITLVQTRSAKKSADSAKEQADQAREANKLTKQSRHASAHQLYVESVADNAFQVTNPMDYSVYKVVVECGGMANHTAYIEHLNPNDSEKFVLSQPAVYLDSVTLDWTDQKGTLGHRRLGAYDIWGHIKKR